MHAHPQFPSLMVYEGQKNELAKAGAFFKPRHGKTLLQICGQAYGVSHSKLGVARKVNSNSWNLDHAIYRASDTNCNAAKVPPTFGPGASNASFGSGSPWIAQCPYADSQQVFWMPPKDEWEIRPEDLVATGPPQVGFTPFKPTPTPSPPLMTFTPSVPSGPGIELGADLPGPDTWSPVVGDEPKKSKWWILGLAAGALVLGYGVYAWRKK